MAAAIKKGKKSHRDIAAFNFLSNIPLDVNTKESKFCFLQIAANSNKNAKLSRTDSPVSVPEESEPLDQVDPDSEHAEHCVQNVHDVVHTHLDNRGGVDSVNKIRTPRPASVDVGIKHRCAVVRQTSEHVIGNTRACLPDSGRDDHHDDVHEEDDFILDFQPSIQPVLPRHGSVSGERDRSKYKTKKLQSSFSAENAGIFPTDYAERKRHRSSSLSTDSGDSVPSRQHSGIHKEIRFLSMKSEKRVKGGRMVLLSKERAPLVIYSILPSTKHKKQLSNVMEADSSLPGARRVSGIPVQRPLSSSHEGILTFGLDAMEYIEDGQDISYSQFLVPSRHKQQHRRTATHDGVSALNSSAENTALAAGLPVQQLFRSVSYDPSLALKTGLQTPPIVIKDKELTPTHVVIKDPLYHKNYTGFDYDMTSELVYDPNMLDDPELSSGKHRTLLTFTSYMTSIIDYCKPSDLKQELNEKFRERFPHISLTLSKLRSLKRELRKIGHVKCSIDLWTVAQSYVTFEKLILKGLISKSNRKLCAGASLLLSAKLNDIKKSDLTKLIDEIEDTFKVQRKELLAFEVAILIALEFTLHIPDYEVYPHYQRLMYTS